MKNNIELFDYSLQNPEPLVDDFYIKEKNLIISSSPATPNQLIKINRELLDNITAYRIAVSKKNKEMRLSILKNIHALMQNEGLNFSEFASFWAVVDVSYSTYLSLPKLEQLKFLDSVIKKYLELRHETYLSHGYSATTLQVGKDAKAHKSSGNLGGAKTATILVKNGYSPLSDLTLKAFQGNDKVFIFSDKSGKKLFKEIISTTQIKFLWGPRNQNKMPDILLKHGKDIYIIEHKHMKEGGGGQDKQVVEIVDFINYSEPGATAIVHYIVFLDGLYFNLFASQTTKNGKLTTQIANIRKNLKTNPKNYFLNTVGFYELFKQINAM